LRIRTPIVYRHSPKTIPASASTAWW
jgi:hypothetical protein